MEKVTDPQLTTLDVKPLGPSAVREIGSFSLWTKGPTPQEVAGKYVVVWEKVRRRSSARRPLPPFAHGRSQLGRRSPKNRSRRSLLRGPPDAGNADRRCKRRAKVASAKQRRGGRLVEGEYSAFREPHMMRVTDDGCRVPREAKAGSPSASKARFVGGFWDQTWSHRPKRSAPCSRCQSRFAAEGFLKSFLSISLATHRGRYPVRAYERFSLTAQQHWWPLMEASNLWELLAGRWHQSSTLSNHDVTFAVGF
jgi:hypothetical protein